MKKDSRFEKGATFILSDVPVKWAKVYDPEETPWGVKQWTVTAVLSDKVADALEECGMKTKVDKDGDRILQITRAVDIKDGKKLFAPTVKDTLGNVMTDAIGNGSVCDIEVYAKYAEVQKKTYLKPKLNALVVKAHIPYEGRTITIF